MRSVIIISLLIVNLAGCALSENADEIHPNRQKRADDTNPLEAVVNTLSADVAQLKARMGRLNSLSSVLLFLK